MRRRGIAFDKKLEAVEKICRVLVAVLTTPMEGFWGILKCEMYSLCSFQDYDSLVAAIESYIYFYTTNADRRS